MKRILEKYSFLVQNCIVIEKKGNTIRKENEEIKSYKNNDLKFSP